MNTKIIIWKKGTYSLLNLSFRPIQHALLPKQLMAYLPPDQGPMDVLYVTHVGQRRKAWQSNITLLRTKISQSVAMSTRQKPEAMGHYQQLCPAC